AAPRVPANVKALGAVSLVTDVSSEMVTAVLRLYLVLGLHLGPAAYGAVDGVYTGATALLRTVGGYVATGCATASWWPAPATRSPRWPSSACSPPGRQRARSSPSIAPAMAFATPDCRRGALGFLRASNRCCCW